MGDFPEMPQNFSGNDFAAGEGNIVFALTEENNSFMGIRDYTALSE